MTPNELYGDVAAMGFERGFTDNGIFYHAANRALDTLSARFPKEKAITLMHRVPRPLYFADTVIHEGGTENAISADGVRAYAFSASGGADVYVYKNDALFARHQFANGRALTPVYGAFDKPSSIRLILRGASDYPLHELFFFETRDLAEGCGVVFHKDETDYSLRDLCQRAVALIAPPERANGTPLTEGCDYRISADMQLTLKNNVPDVYRLRFALDHERLTPDSSEIDLREDAMYLLPTLTAAYAWLEQDSDKALFYHKLYREALSAREKFTTAAKTAPYGDVNGW